MRRAGAAGGAAVWLAWLLAGCGGAPGTEDVPDSTYADYTAPSYVLDVPYARDVGTAPPVCSGGRSVCGGRTCRDLRSEHDHCGSCDAACGSRERCVAGACTPLEGDQAYCNGGLVHLDSDDRNCGDCARRCSAGEICTLGVCREFPCEGALTHCGLGRECVDLASEPLHCGRCDNACGAMQRCTAGVCADRCAGGLTWCADEGLCTDLRTDARRCGACTHPCGESQVCELGTCTTPCAAGSAHCLGPTNACADLQGAVDHCGACSSPCASANTASSRCERGECQVTCATGYTLCGGPRGQCLSLGSDAANCGACGRVCETGDHCAAGECRAPGVRPISPLSGTRIASWRPRFRWDPPLRGGAVVVEVCSSRDCHSVEGSQRVATGDEVRWLTPLAPGPHWWRARSGTGEMPGPTWEFFIPELDAPVPLVGAVVPDFNGDGIGDTIGAPPTPCPSNRSCIGVHYSRSLGAAPVGPTMIQSPESYDINEDGYPHSESYSFRGVGSFGDFNGDGFVDLLASLHSISQHGSHRYPNQSLGVHFGASSGIPSVEAGGGGPFSHVDRFNDAGDLDGDGYADLFVVGGWRLDETYCFIYFGGATGGDVVNLYVAPSIAYLQLADFNGDGINDLALSWILSVGSRDTLLIRMGRRGERSPTFQPMSGCGSISGVAFRGRPIAITDTTDSNGDGYPDLTAEELTLTSPATFTWLGGPDGLSAERCVVGVRPP